MPHRRSQVAGNRSDPRAAGLDCLPCSLIAVEDMLRKGKRAALSTMTGMDRENRTSCAKQSQSGDPAAPNKANFAFF